MLGGYLLGGHIGAATSDLLDGRLSAPDEHRARLHLGRCRFCAAAVAAEQEARDALRHAATADDRLGPSNNLMAGLLALSMPAGTPSAPIGSSAPLGGHAQPPGAGAHLPGADAQLMGAAAATADPFRYPSPGSPFGAVVADGAVPAAAPAVQPASKLEGLGPAPARGLPGEAGRARRSRVKGALVLSTVLVSSVSVVAAAGGASSSPPPAATRVGRPGMSASTVAGSVLFSNSGVRPPMLASHSVSLVLPTPSASP